MEEGGERPPRGKSRRESHRVFKRGLNSRSLDPPPHLRPQYSPKKINKIKILEAKSLTKTSYCASGVVQNVNTPCFPSAEKRENTHTLS